MEALRAHKGFVCDMDGVVYHGHTLLPGVTEFLAWLTAEGKKFLFLTNSSERTPRELREKLLTLGIDVDEQHFFTSALATADFLSRQCPGGSAYVIGESGITNALYDGGFSMNDRNPDYVVVAESQSYSYEKLERAVNLIRNGARLIGTNPDVTGPGEHGVVPATGSLIAPIESATGVKAYFVGKPNPLMMRHAIGKLGCRREETAVIGDRMDTDIVAGIEADIDTVLVLSGVTAREDLPRFPYKPTYVLEGVGDIPPVARGREQRYRKLLDSGELTVDGRSIYRPSLKNALALANNQSWATCLASSRSRYSRSTMSESAIAMLSRAI